MKKLPFSLPSFNTDKLKGLISGKGSFAKKSSLPKPILDKKKGSAKKIIVATVVVLALAGIALCGTYYWTGMKIEKQYRDYIEQFSNFSSQQLFGGQQVKYSISYERGVFCSSAKTTYAVSVPVAVPMLEQLTIRSTQWDTISHGPFPMAKAVRGDSLLPPKMLAYIESKTELDTKVGLPEEIEAIYTEIGSLLATTSATKINVDGSVAMQIVNPAAAKKTITFKALELEIGWGGMTNLITVTPDQHISSSAEFPEFSIASTSMPFSFSLTGGKATTNLQSAASGMLTGDASVTFTEMNFAGQDNEKMRSATLAGLSLAGKTSESGGSLSSSSSLKLDAFTMDARALGPVEVEVEVRNIDAAAVVKLQRLATEMQKAQADGNQDSVGKLFGDVTAMIPELIKKSPELELKKLSVTTPDGDFSGTAKITIDGSSEVPIASPVMLISMISAQAEMQVSERLVAKSAQSALKTRMAQQQDAGSDNLDVLAARQSRQQLEMLVRQKMLVKEGDYFKAVATYEKGVFTVNGQDIPIQNFFGR